jgi:hypothetical protein
MACGNSCRGKHDPYSYGCNYFPPRVIKSEDVTAYAQRAGALTPDELCFVQACLITGRLIYWKQNPGDCPTQTRLSFGPGGKIAKVGSLGLSGVGAASSISLFATGGAGIGASAGGSGAVLGGLPALAGTAATVVGLALIPLIVWNFISAHHKIAVAREQATICDVTQAYNQWEETIEYGIAYGQATVLDSKNAVPVMEQQLQQALQAIKKECNAACYHQKAVKALNLYAVEKLYDSLNPRGSGNPANPAQPGMSQGGSGLAVVGIAGAGIFAAAKLAGALA